MGKKDESYCVITEDYKGVHQKTTDEKGREVEEVYPLEIRWKPKKSERWDYSHLFIISIEEKFLWM